MTSISDLYNEKSIQLLQLTQRYIDKFMVIWARMYDGEVCMKNFDSLVVHAEHMYEKVVEESLEKEEYIINEIKNLKIEAEKLRKMLNIDMNVKTRNDVPLVAVQIDLGNYVENLRQSVQQRQEEIRNLLLEQSSLCEQLGDSPRALSTDPLPTAEEITDFEKHLAKLKEERLERLKKISAMRHEIKGFLEMLELHVANETDDRLLNGREIKLDNETFIGLTRMYRYYDSKVQDMRDKIDGAKEKLERLWDHLDTSPNTRKKFSYTKYTQTCLDAINSELNRCRLLCDHNTEKFVNQIRQEIVEWWNKTLQSDEQRSSFSDFNSKCYNNDLLTTHEIELENLKQYYNKNKNLFELLEKRTILWNRMIALEQKASDPARFNNRGGQLLKEEKERKTIAVTLPKIEQKIADLAKEYEEREKKHFLVYGKNIIDVIAEDWEKNRQDKHLGIARRKVQIQKTSPSFHAAENLRITPVSKSNISSSSPQNRKRKISPRDKLAPVTKRSLLYSAKNPSVFLKPTTVNNRTSVKSPIKVPHVLGTTNRRRSGRSSNGTGARKRRSTNRLNIPKIVITDDTKNPLNETYQSFENSITPTSRSSINPKFTRIRTDPSTSHGSQRMRIGSTAITPSASATHSAPETSPSYSQSTSSNRKLTTKNLPIII